MKMFNKIRYYFRDKRVVKKISQHRLINLSNDIAKIAFLKGKNNKI